MRLVLKLSRVFTKISKKRINLQSSKTCDRKLPIQESRRRTTKKLEPGSETEILMTRAVMIKI